MGARFQLEAVTHPTTSHLTDFMTFGYDPNMDTLYHFIKSNKSPKLASLNLIHGILQKIAKKTLAEECPSNLPLQLPTILSQHAALLQKLVPKNVPQKLSGGFQVNYSEILRIWSTDFELSIQMHPVSKGVIVDPHSVLLPSLGS